MGKQGGDLKWWGSTSSTVLLDPAAFVESWKRQIQGKDGIPAKHQRLIFPYRDATQEGLSYTCKRSSRCPRAKESAASDFLRELRSWKALLKSNNHVIAQLLRPVVAAEDEEIAAHLYCETVKELRGIGIPCNVYYLFFDKWLLAAPLESDKCCKISSNINIQIDKDFQSKRFEILLFGRLNGNNLPVPFVYQMNGGEVAALISMHDQTAKYRQGHEMRRLGLSAQSVEKGVEGRDFNAAVEIGRSLNGCHGSDHHDNQYIRCGKGLELTAIVTKDPPRQFKYIVLAVIQVHPVGAPRRLDPGTTHTPTVQQVSEWRRGGGKAGLQADCNGFNLSSCTTAAHKCDMYSHDNHRTVVESRPATSCHLDEHLTTSASDIEYNVSLASEGPIQSQGSSVEHTVGEGNVEDMGSELTELHVVNPPNVDEPAGKNSKKKKKRKGKRSGRSTADGNSTIQGVESLPVLVGVNVASDTQTVVTEGVKFQSPCHSISEGSLEKRLLDEKLSQLVNDIKETDRQECVSGRQGEPGEVLSLLSHNLCSDDFGLGNSLEAVDGLDASTVQCPDSSLEEASNQVGRFRDEPTERLDTAFDAIDIEEEHFAHTEYVSRTGNDVCCPPCPNTEYGMSGVFRDSCAVNASPDCSYMSTSNGLSQRLSKLQPSEHVIDVIDLVSLDGVLQDPLIPENENSVCKTEGSHFPLRELAGNLESLSDPKEQFNHSDTKVSARGGYNSGGTGGRSGRGDAEGSSNRGYRRGSDEGRGTSGYHGGSGQGSGGSGQGTGPGSSGTSGSGGSGEGWEGRPAENDGGNGSKEGDGDERHRHSFQAGSNGEITSESLQRKKGTSPLDNRSAKKVTIGTGDQLSNGNSSTHGILATTSGGGKENNHTFWQKVQKSVEVEEVTELEQLGETFGSHMNHLRKGSDEFNTNNRADSKARPLSIHVNGNVSHESPHEKESSFDLDSSEQGTLTRDLSMKTGKPSNSEWLPDHAEVSNSIGCRRVRDVMASASTLGPDSSKGAWQRKISSDEQRQNSQKNVSEIPQHAGSSKGQISVKQLSVRFTRNGAYARGHTPDQQTISHTRSYSAPSTPHVFEESYSDAGEFNHCKSMKHGQGVMQQSAGSGSSGQTEQMGVQISLRPHSSHASSVSQLGDARPVPDELAQRLTSWKGRKPTGEQERSVPREKIVGERDRTIHCAQKWVPVEHKTSAGVRASNAQAKTATNVSVAVPVTFSCRDRKENPAESATCKQSVIGEEEGRADGVSCRISPSKSSRRLQTFLGGSKASGSVEQVSELRESAVASESPCVHAEPAKLRSLLPRERVADTPATVAGSESSGHHITVAQKSEMTKASVSGERKGFSKRDTARRDVTGALCVRPDLYPAETETRTAVRDVLDAVQASCRRRRASEKVAGMLGSPLAEFEKVLAAVAPSFIPVADPNCGRRAVLEKGGSYVCGFERDLRAQQETCFSEAHEDYFTDSRCRYSNTPVSSLWQWYEEPSYYGVEVGNLDSHRSHRDGGEQEQFLAYFVPYLSGLQFFGYPSQSEGVSRDMSGCAETTSKSDVFASCHPRSFPGNDVLAKLFPSPGRAEESTHHQRSEGSVSELANGPCNDMSAKDAHNLDTRLLFEFFDADQPQVRQPLYPKVKDLLKGVNSLNSHTIGDPASLEDLCLGELHPASWFAVAWYPIYRIPEGPLRAVFLTYHSFHHITPKSSVSGLMGGSCEDMNENSLSLPVVGLECYNLQAEPWLSLRSQCKEAQSTEKLPIGNVAQCLNDRIRSLKDVAELMAKGVPHDVGSRSTEGSSSSSSSSGSVSKFKHCDYEFFLKRRR